MEGKTSQPTLADSGSNHPDCVRSECDLSKQIAYERGARRSLDRRVDDCFHDLSRDRSVLHQVEKTQLKDEKKLVEVKLDMERMNRSVLDELACTRGELARSLSHIATLTQDHKNLLGILVKKGLLLHRRGLELMIWRRRRT